MTNNEKIVRDFIAYFEKSWPDSFDEAMNFSPKMPGIRW